MNSLLQNLRSLGTVRLAAIAGVGIASVAFFTFIIARLSTPPMGLLYADLDLRDSGQVVAKLEALHIPYEVRADGAQVLVPIDQVARLRMTMAEQGLPRGGSIGYEIFDKGEGLSTSTFQQNMNQLRALEGELSRTIASLATVQAARVHLVLPHRELFSRERQEPSASIVLKLRGGERLSRTQVAAIQHLVAGAVPELRPGKVVIVDTEGTLLARDGGQDTGVGAGQGYLELRTAYETRLSRTIEDMLDRSLGAGKARAEVHADIDFDRVTTNTETFDPDGQVIRSAQSSKETSDTSGENSGDQPVSVSTNLPDAQKAQAPNGATQSKTGRNEETTNYEISKTVKNHVHEGGDLRRLSVAVLVDGNYTLAADGTRTYQPRSPEELQQLTTLVKSAIGYDQKRGDSVEIVNLKFAVPEEPSVEAAAGYLGLGKQDFMRIGETVGLVVAALVVILLVVRPLINRVFETLPGNSVLAPEGPRLLTHNSPATAALPPPGGALVRSETSGLLHDDGEQMIDLGQVEGRVRASSVRKVGEIVEKHPEEALSIVRSWMYQR